MAETRPSGLVAADIRERIADGSFRPGEPLPSYRELCQRMGVGQVVLQSALDALEREGRIVRLPRRGVFVRAATPPPQAPGLKCVCIISEGWSYTSHIGFVYQEMMDGFSLALEALPIKMRLKTVPQGQPCPFDSLLSDLFPFQEQACVLCHVPRPELMNWLSERKVPYVFLSRIEYAWHRLPPHHRIYASARASFFEATQHLINLGHRRIGFVGAALRNEGCSYALEGFQAAMSCAGLEAASEDVADFWTRDPNADIEPFLAYLQRPGRPTAVVARTDLTALCLLKAARQLNLRVPADLSVVGYDDHFEAGLADPPLTTISPRRRYLAQRGVEMLLRLVRGGVEGYLTEVLSSKLVVRASTAPPGGGDIPRNPAANGVATHPRTAACVERI